MKILTVVFSLGKGGTERTAQNFAIAYHELGYDSRVLFVKHDGIRRKQFEARGIRVYEMGMAGTLREISFWKPDIVHFHSLGITLEEFEMIKENAPDARLIETNVFSSPSPWAAQIHVSFQLSEWCNWLFQKRSQGKYTSCIIPNPIDTASFQRAGIADQNRFREKYKIGPDDLVIGRVGQFFESKWSPVLFDLYESLQKTYPGLKLLLVNPSESIIKKATKMADDKIIIINEIKSDVELSACYSVIDLFVHIAEQGESFGMVLTESLLCGTPVVAFNTPWGDNSQAEVIGNGIGGYVTGSRHEFLQRAIFLLGNKAVRFELGTSGRKRIIESYDSKVVAQKAIEVATSSKSSINSIQAGPLELSKKNLIKMNCISQIILKHQRGLWMLRYSTGYSKFSYFPVHVFKHTKARIERMFERT